MALPSCPITAAFIFFRVAVSDIFINKKYCFSSVLTKNVILQKALKVNRRILVKGYKPIISIIMDYLYLQLM